MSQNTAITIKNSLKKAIENSLTECSTIASLISQFIDEELWEYLDLPGDLAADKLLKFVTMPYDRGGLNCDLNHFYALISISPEAERKFRSVVNKTEQGTRNDLKLKNDGSDASEFQPKKKPRGASNSNKANDRAAERAAKAVPELDRLLNEGLVSKRNAAKVGQVIKDPNNLTDRERKIVEQREQLNTELEKIVPETLPEEPQERKKLRKEVQQVIEKTTGKITPPKISLGDDPKEVAEAIVKASNDLEYLRDLTQELELVIDSIQSSLQIAS